MAAGASTAGFLEKVAADLDRELSTFKYPAMFPAEIAQRVDTRRNSRAKKGAKRTGASRNILSFQRRPPSLPGGTRWRDVGGGDDSEAGLKERRRGCLSWPFASFPTFLMNNHCLRMGKK